MSAERSRGPQTTAIHAGEAPDPATGASSPNLVMSTTYVVDPDVSFSAEDMGAETPFVYARWGNPTVDQLERKLAALEGAQAAVAFASGMAAITGLLYQFLRPGDHLVVSDVSYAGTAELVESFLGRNGIAVTRADLSDPQRAEAAFRPETRLVLAETPCNPILRLTDIAAIADIAHRRGALLAVDSTFATPIATRPLELGADLVVHSLTKYIGGHGDALGGAVLGRAEDMQRLRQGVGIHFGGAISPFNAWLILRGAATLPLRMAAHAAGSLRVAAFLEAHPRVRRTIHPGLPSHPQHALARRQMRNHSGMLTFQADDGRALARRLAERLQVVHYAVSLGHHRSLVFHLPTDDLLRTSFRLDADGAAAYRAFAGDGIFRLSVGLEDPEDLIADLAQALA